MFIMQEWSFNYLFFIEKKIKWKPPQLAHENHKTLTLFMSYIVCLLERESKRRSEGERKEEGKVIYRLLKSSFLLLQSMAGAFLDERFW